MSSEHFQQQYLDDLDKVDAQRNYFVDVWDRVLRAGLRPRNLLDVGCGTGVFSVYIREQTGCSLFGVDGSAYALEQARRRGYAAVATIADFNSDTLPYADEAFDFVLCKDVLEHLVHPLHVVSECRRVLTSGGRMLVHVPNHFSLLGRIKFLFDANIDTFRFFPGATRWDFPHLRFFVHDEFARLLRDTGFELLMDLSECFPSVPLLNRLPGMRSTERSLARQWPSQFAGAFTLLLRKI